MTKSPSGSTQLPNNTPCTGIGISQPSCTGARTSDGFHLHRPRRPSRHAAGTGQPQGHEPWRGHLRERRGHHPRRALRRRGHGDAIPAPWRVDVRGTADTTAPSGSLFLNKKFDITAPPRGTPVATSRPLGPPATLSHDAWRTLHRHSGCDRPRDTGDWRGGIA